MKPHEAKRDHYRRLAKEQGYRSRSAYKLKQLNKAYRIIGPGFVVLDLGCAPGGWLQVAVQAAGNRGKVIGVDISYVEEIHGTEILRADIENDGIHEEIANAAGMLQNSGYAGPTSFDPTGFRTNATFEQITECIL